LVKDSDAVLEHVDELFCCGVDPTETVANDLGIVRLSGGKVERRPARVERTVAPDEYATASPSTSRFDHYTPTTVR
jgi:hypothetical protein